MPGGGVLYVSEADGGWGVGGGGGRGWGWVGWGLGIERHERFDYTFGDVPWGYGQADCFVRGKLPVAPSYSLIAGVSFFVLLCIH